MMSIHQPLIDDRGRATPNARSPRHRAALRLGVQIVQGCTALLIIGGAAYAAGRLSRGIDWLGIAALVVDLVLIALAVRFREFPFGIKTSAGSARKLVECGQCGACGYELRAIPPDPDACTTCPECAAAWRLPPPASTPTQ